MRLMIFLAYELGGGVSLSNPLRQMCRRGLEFSCHAKGAVSARKGLCETDDQNLQFLHS